MAATVVKKIMADGPKFHVVHVTVVGDAGGDLTDSEIVAATSAPNGSIQKIQYMSSGVTGLIRWAGATSTLAATLPPDSSNVVDFLPVGGLQNTATTPTGAITLSTVGLALGDSMSFVLTVKKS